MQHQGAEASPPPPELFHLMVDSVRDYAMFMLTPDGRIQTWNRGAERIKGYRAQEVIGRHFSVFYPASDVRAGKPEYELRVAAEVGRFEDEDWRIRKDGVRFWANVIITAVRDADGLLVGYAKVTRDLSERKRAELERDILLEAERQAREQAELVSARLDALQSITEAGLHHVGPEEQAVALVTRLEAIFAAEQAGIVLALDGERRVLAEHGEDTLDAAPVKPLVERVLETRTPLLVQEGLPGAGGPDVAGSWLGVPLTSDDEVIGAIYVGSPLPGRFRDDDLTLMQMVGTRVSLAVDHARAVQAEQAARAQALAARESAQLRNEFIAVAAHELKTPLTSIRVAAQMAARALGDASPPATSLIEQVVAQSGRLNRLVAALLDASRADLGRLEMAPEETDVARVVQEVVANLRRTSDRQVALVAEVEALPAEVDPLRFEQVAMNLVDNALKYSPPDRPVEVGLRREAETFVLSVRDYGPGIPEDLRERVFERFFQGHAATHQSGLGLGLHITREIVRAHGGDLTAEFPEQGSLFIVRMPVVYSPPAQPAASAGGPHPR